VILLLGGTKPALAAWNIDLTRELWNHEESAASTISLAVSANGKLLLAGQTGRVSVLEAGSGRAVGDLTCPVGALRAVAFSPDASLVAAGGDDFALCLWNLESRQLVAASKAARLDVHGIAFSPDGRKIAVAAEHLFVFDVPR
jgi:WD40 repeat protein